MATLTRIPHPKAIRDYVGKTLGPSDWVEVTQERIDAFADATDDHQWIHVEVERARAESPFGGPIAHGYLTLSLAPTLLNQILLVEGDITILNTGLSKMRLSAPVPAGARVRLTTQIKRAREMPGGGVSAIFAIRIEVEGSKKPALTAECSLVYLPKDDAAA